MKSEGELHRLRIYINESDRWEGRPLYETIVRIAREQGLAGATALRGIEGFGAKNRVHTVKILRLSEDLPIVVEIVDRPERIAAFLPTLDGMVAEGMVTLEKVHTIFFRRESGVETQLEDELQLESPEFSPVEPAAVAASTSGAVALTDQAHKVLDAAKDSANKSRRVFADSVDILLAMLCEAKGIARRALTNLGIDCKSVERSFQDDVSREEPSKAFLGRLEKRSKAAAKWLDDENIGTEHLLLALCEIRPSTATDTLMRLGAPPRDICREVLKIHGHKDDWQRWLADHPEM